MNGIGIKIREKLNAKNITALLFSVFQLCYLFVLLRTSVSKLIILLFVLPVFLFNFAFIKFTDKNASSLATIKDKIKFYLPVTVVSLLFCKSLCVEIFSPEYGALSIPAGIGIAAFSFQLVIFLVFALEKINLSAKPDKKKHSIFLYAIPSAIILTFLYLVYFPGVRSIDSLMIWTDVGMNSYNDAHPIIYMFLIKFLRLLWNDIAVMTLFNTVISVFTFAFVANELGRMGLPKWACWAVAVILPLFPANALYSVTMWKDVPYTMGLIILSILILRCFTGDYYYSKRALPQIFFAALFTLFMRHNALFSVFLPLFIVGVYYLVKKDKKLIIKTLILGAALIVSYFGIKNITVAALSSEDTGGSFSGQTLVTYNFPPTIAEQQLIYTEGVVGESFTPEEREAFEVIFNMEGLKAHKEKYWENDIWMYYHKPGETTYHKCSVEYFWDYYFKIWKRFPRQMAIGYQKITSIIWSSSSYGQVAYRGTTDNVNVEGLEPYEFRPIIKRFMDAKLFRTVFNYNDSSFTAVFWRPAFPFMLSLILLIAAYRKHGRAAWFVLMPVIFNQITYLIVIASQDTRYVYINYTMFIVMFCLALLKPADKQEGNITP